MREAVQTKDTMDFKRAEMKIKFASIAAFFLIASVFLAGCANPSPESKDYAITPVDFTEVRILDDFWAPRIETNRSVTIPFAMQQNEQTGRVDNFRIAGGLKPGKYRGERYNDTDVYKVLEGASVSLALKPEVKLNAEVDALIAIIGAAQESDGYLFTSRTCDPDNPLMGTGQERWSNLAVSHELYNAGHLYEAAVAHYLATGKRSFLEIALKNADLVAATFDPDLKHDAPGHQEIELGLVKLFRVTGDQKYLDLAKFFLDQRGQELALKIYPEGHRFSIYNDPIQIQAHMPILEQDEAVGHAVRCMYMYAGMADVAALTGDPGYIQALERLWTNVVGKKMSLTGGVGARHEMENFGENYELPNLTSYNETCAAIGMVFWNHRMFLLHGDARYLDVLERVLYNGVITGVSLEGNTFFYPNPLESDGKYRFNKGKAGRQPWFGTACCPGNIARFLPAVPGYVYARTQDSLYINLFLNSEIEIEMSGQPIKVRQETSYPWEGQIRVFVESQKPVAFTTYIRIPGWARNKPVPSDLYRYVYQDPGTPRVRINGQEVPLELRRGFALLHRTWKREDVIEVNLPMPVRRVISHTQVKENLGKVALERGPLVYCAEWPDNPSGLASLALSDASELSPVFQENMLGGLAVIQGEARLIRSPGEEPEPSPVAFMAIPYYAWAHRGEGEMAVWLRRMPDPGTRSRSHCASPISR